MAFTPRADRLNAPAISKSLGNDGSMVAFRRLWEKYQKYIRGAVVAIRAKEVAPRDRRQHYQLPRANVLPVVKRYIIRGSWRKYQCAYAEARRRLCRKCGQAVRRRPLREWMNGEI